MAESVNTSHLDVVVDVAGADQLMVDLCLRRLRGHLPVTASLQVADLSDRPLRSLGLVGGHIAIVDPRVDLTAIAFECIASTLARDPSIGMLYGQEVIGPERVPRHLPVWSPERLRNHDYLPGLVVLSRSVALGALPPTAPSPLHRWELVLRAGEVAERVHHVGATLSHRRSTFDEGPAEQPDDRSGLRVLQAHCNRIGLRALATHGPRQGVYRARRISHQSPSISLLFPGPHHGASPEALVHSTNPDGLRIVVVCAPGENIETSSTATRLVHLPEPTDDLGERLRWALSACDTEFIGFAPSDASTDDPMWLTHLAGLLSDETIAAGPRWSDTISDADRLGSRRDSLESEVESLPLAGLVLRRRDVATIIDRAASGLEWLEPFLRSDLIRGNLVASDDVQLSRAALDPDGSIGPDAGIGSWFKRSRRRVFPLPA